MNAADRLAGLTHCRAVLLRVTAGLSVEALDHRHFPDAKSNGEILLHIAGFEFLIIATAQLMRGTAPGLALWASLKPGFAREAGFAAPLGRGLADYIELLAAVRDRTAAYLAGAADANSLDAAGLAIERMTQALADADPGEDRDRYRRLAAAISSSFADDGAPDAAGRVDIAAMLALHETYHRGQITLNKYVRSRLAGGDARR